MNIITNAIAELTSERNKLDQAIVSLAALSTDNTKATTSTSASTKGKRVFSLATRRKLAASQRARWARIKAAGKQLKIAKKAA